MATTVLGWANIVTEPDVLIQVFGVTSILPPTNLQTQIGNPTMAWRAPLSQSGGYPLLRFTPASRRIFGAIGFFRSNLTPTAQVTVQVYTGANTLQFNEVIYPVGGNGQIISFPPAVAGDFCQVQFIDLNNPDGVINISLAYAGPVWIPATGASWATTHGRDDDTEVLVSRGGEEFVTLKWQRRRIELALDGVRQSEVWPQVDVLRRAARTGINVLAVPDATNGYAQYETVFGRLQDTSDITYPYGNGDRRAWHAKITERL